MSLGGWVKNLETIAVNVSLTVDEKVMPMHAFAAIDILILLMWLGFASASVVHLPGVAVELSRSETRFAVPNERLVLTVKGAVEPSFYIGAKPIAESELVQTLRRKRDEEGLRMVVVRADRRLPATWLKRLSGIILNEGLDCGWLSEPLPTALAP